MNITNNYCEVTINNYTSPQPSFILEVICELPINHTQEKAIVDQKWFQHLSTFRWTLVGSSMKHVISTTHINGIQRYLSVYLMMLEGKYIEGYDVDHIDRNPFNNVISNLRLCTRQENIRNRGKREGTSSRYIGVTWDKSRSLWSASIGHNWKHIGLGRYVLEEEAARAYDDALRTLPGRDEFKVYNFPR